MKNLLLWSLICSSSLQANPIMDEICHSIIPFALENGSEISRKDLFHCHTVLQLKEGDERTYSYQRPWSYLLARRWAYVCHAHEHDGKRVNDNFNIFYRQGEVSYWGTHKNVVEKHVLERYNLPKQQYKTTWTNIYFYPSKSPYCTTIVSSQEKTCGGKTYCIGLGGKDTSRLGWAIDEKNNPTNLVDPAFR